MRWERRACTVAGVLLLAAAWASADYLEVRRSATIKRDPSGDAVILERAEPGVLLPLLRDGEQTNGYYQVQPRQAMQPGWIYRTLVRRHAGEIPVPPTAATTWEDVVGELVETVPDFYRTELHTYKGIPLNQDPSREVRVLVNLGYSVGYSEDLRVPLWVAYRLGNSDVESADEYYFERPPRFQVDLRTTTRVTWEEYTSSGFDRGHMAPNFAIRSQYGHVAQLETFLMSNICAQSAGLNRSSWRTIEHQIAAEMSQVDRSDGDPVIDDLWVVTGSIFDRDGQMEFIGPNGDIAVPDRFYKVIVRRRTFRPESVEGIAVIYGQDPGANPPAFCPIDEVEELTGFDFHPRVAEEISAGFESRVRDLSWGGVE